MNYDKIDRLSFNNTLIRSFKLYADNFTFLFFIALVGSVPLILIPELNDIGTANNDPGSIGTLFFRLFLLIVVNTFVFTFMTDYLARKYVNTFHTTDEYFRYVVPLVGQILGLAIIEGVLILLGVMMFIIPGVYFALALSMSNIVLVIERPGVLNSVRRSIFLTHGRKLEIIGYTLLLVVLFFIGFLFSAGVLWLLNPLELSTGAKNLFFHLIQVAVSPLNSTLFLLIYFNIRIDKEGFTLEKWTGRPFDSPPQ